MSTRPRITFDSLGKCNACTWVEEKKTLDWSKRKLELENLLDMNRSKDGSHDCIVPVSGGKDGSYVAHQLKHVYGMNPLAITVAPALPLELGNINLENFITSGYTHIKFSHNPKSLATVNKQGFIKWGFPYFGWLMGIMTVPVRIAIQMDIALIFYGEDGEVEYGGSNETKNHAGYDLEYMRDIYFEKGQDVILESTNLSKSELYWYKFPTHESIAGKKLKIVHYSYFENWDPYRNYLIAKEKSGLKEAISSNEGTFTNFAQNDQGLYALHAYLMYLKFGFGRATQDAGIEIRRGAMSREQGMNLVKLYDGIFPTQFLDSYLEYFEMTTNQFFDVLQNHANQKLFHFENNRFKPKFEIK